MYISVNIGDHVKTCVWHAQYVMCMLFRHALPSCVSIIYAVLLPVVYNGTDGAEMGGWSSVAMHMDLSALH